MANARVMSAHMTTTPASPPVLAVVVPCFDEELVVGDTAARLSALLEQLRRDGQVEASSFLYFVDDGSRDRTWEIIAALHEQDARVKGLRLARNVGTQNALLAGMLGVREHADCVVSIDADLQQDEQVIPIFLEKYRAGAHVVYGVRRDRLTDAPLKQLTSTFFYKLMNAFGAKIIKNHSEYRLASRKALDAVAEYGEYNLFLRGIFVDIGYRSEIVPFDVRRRAAGTSKHSLGKLAALALEGITSFSVVPLRIVTIAGALIFLWSVLMTLFVLYHKLILGDTIPGWAAILIPIYFLGGVQVMFMGLIGEYIGRIYKEVKRRPRYLKDAELF